LFVLGGDDTKQSQADRNREHPGHSFRTIVLEVPRPDAEDKDNIDFTPSWRWVIQFPRAFVFLTLGLLSGKYTVVTMPQRVIDHIINSS
jgi:hypothetical protein